MSEQPKPFPRKDMEESLEKYGYYLIPAGVYQGVNQEYGWNEFEASLQRTNRILNDKFSWMARGSSI